MEIRRTSRKGDEILVSLSPFERKSLPDALADYLCESKIIEVVLHRTQSNYTIEHTTLFHISEAIFDYMKEHPNDILYYYCDEINQVPKIRQTRQETPAQYRNRLFSLMFHREKEKHPNLPIEDRLIHIETDSGQAFIHLIFFPILFNKANYIENYLYELSQK